MRITYAKLVGYAGFYAGLGKTELELDFTKCKNHVVVISGANGCGKSTLLNALSILPDSNECFLVSMPASKTLQIIDQDVIYDILIIHGLDSKGNRTTTKAYIQKNGLELNPNGNVSSYKDINFNEFNLDSNFISLTHISGNNRGIADKRPADRKKFVASITSSLEVYNDINKKLVKKSNVYRSQINSLSTKLQSIGDESSLRSNIVSLNSRSERLNQEIDDLKQQIIECRTILALNDPNGQLKQKYDKLMEQLEKEDTYRTSTYTSYRNLKDKKFSELSVESIQDIDKELLDVSDNLSTNNDLYFNEKEKLITLNSSIQSVTTEIDELTIKKNKLEQEINPQLEANLESTQKEMMMIEDMFGRYKIGTINQLEEITSDDLQQIIKIGSDILSAIDLIYESIPVDSLPDFVSAVTAKTSISIQITELSNQINSSKDQLMKTKEELSKLELDYQSILELNKKPEKCKFNDCYFLSKYQEVANKYLSIEDIEMQIKNAKCDVNVIESEIINNNEKLNLLKDWVRSEAIIDRIRTLSTSNNVLFNKLGVNTLGDFKIILNHISWGLSFNDIKEIIDHIRDMSNSIIQYKSYKKVYENLMTEIKLNKANKDALFDYIEMIESDEAKLVTIKANRDAVKKSVDFTFGIITRLKEKETDLKDLKSKYQEYLTHETSYNQLYKEIEKLNQQFKGSSEIIQKMSDMNSKILSLQAELEPITKQKQTVDNQLVMLDNYRRDYNEYYEKYNIIDKLKKYSSPTSSGIQTLFMSLYMGKTLSISNQLLGMLFQGQYQLLDYVINEEEFRIPFASNGFAIDDISNGSTSQICMMGMIINLALLHQASTKFNIARLDEIDGGLDTFNRSVFVDILQKIIQILGIDQLFIISHSCESALSNVDAIQLAPITGYEDMSNTGANIIYDWRN